MRIFCTGVSGYIGGSVAVALVAAGHNVSGLVRSEQSAALVRSFGIEPIRGVLDDLEIVRTAAAQADAVINAASADHEASAVTMLEALTGTGKAFIHTSGTSIVGTQAAGRRVDDIFDETTPLKASSGSAARIALNTRIQGFKERNVRSVIICPSLIYGVAGGPAEQLIDLGTGATRLLRLGNIGLIEAPNGPKRDAMPVGDGCGCLSLYGSSSSGGPVTTGMTLMPVRHHRL